MEIILAAMTVVVLVRRVRCEIEEPRSRVKRRRPFVGGGWGKTAAALRVRALEIFRADSNLSDALSY